MKGIFMILLGLALLGFHQQAPAQGKASIVGVWEVLKSDDAPSGSTVEFTNGGKLILIMKKGDESKRIEAGYKVEGNKLITQRTENGKEKLDTLTIQTLTATTLITLNDKGKVDELKRKKTK